MKSSNPISTKCIILGTHCALHHSYSPQEQKYLIRLDIFNQRNTNEAIRQKAHHRQLDLNQFEHLGNMCRLSVPYGALEPCKQHYPNLERAIIDIGTKPVGIPCTICDADNPQQNGRLQYKQFDYLFRFVRSEKKGQIKYAVLEMPFEVMQYYNTIDLGYFKMQPAVYEAFHHQSSRCLYLLAESRLKCGYNKFLPQEIFSLLTSNSHYRGIGNMEYSQLDEAEREIKRAYELKMIDYFVIHKVETMSNKVAGNYGQFVMFSVKYRSEDTQQMSKEDSIKLSQKKTAVYQVLNSWKINKSVCGDLVDRMTLDDYDAVSLTISDIYKQYKMHKVHDLAAYTVYSLNKILKPKDLKGNQNTKPSDEK